MCIFPKMPEPQKAPAPPSPSAAQYENANVARERAIAGAASGRKSTMLTSITDDEAKTPVRRKTLLGE